MHEAALEAVLPRLIEWSPRPSRLLLLGGEEVRKGFDNQQLRFEELHIANSEKRFLFVVEREE